MNFRANIVDGLLVLAPLGIVVLVLAKGVEILHEISEPLAEMLRVESGIFVGTSAVLVAAMGLVLTCYLVGSFVRTPVGSWSFDKLEKPLLKEPPRTSPEEPRVFGLRVPTSRQREQLVPKQQVWHRSQPSWLRDLDGIPAKDEQ